MTDQPPPEWAIKAVAAALSRAEIYDDRVTSDRARIIAWAESFTRYGIEQADAIAGVVAHYDQPGAQTPKPGDIIELARKVRRERAEREKADEVASLPPAAPPDPQLAGLPIAGADGEPIWNAYEQHDAILRTCPTCKAEPETACVNLATNMVRKIPCAARMKQVGA
ncbi:hypothetical protein ACPXB3_22230 [Gordonia sp. DT219]|uniref:hypothetical protein n=1 Tax=Gordonia sp. DT219 TaxID=3416658 RepID=UPI003CEC3A16